MGWGMGGSEPRDGGIGSANTNSTDILPYPFPPSQTTIPWFSLPIGDLLTASPPQDSAVFGCHWISFENGDWDRIEL